MWPEISLQQTFGVELEFVVKTPLGHLDQRIEVEELMARLFVAGGFATNDIGALDSYDKWSIARDSSIRSKENEDEDPDPLMVYFGVEVKSRILPVNPASFSEIRQIVDILNKNFKIPKNKSTGLHVHIIDIREGPFHAVAQIEKIGNLSEFIDQVNPDDDRFFAYNFTHLKRKANSKQTVEFRQHAGTMDADRILAWADFTTGMVEYCHRIDPDRLMTLLLTFGANDEFSLLNLLQIIGKAHLIEHYKPRLVNRARPEILFRN
ncbi:MAG: hypothetical protein M1830_008009 [Pleopsidium flavum]|nr:MAG: hypothetical protein M1830_008009 [Pleopsidium flavum]